MDPWVIAPPERERHTQQFMSLKPEAGFISGGQAKNFLMQSGLPPMVLAQVWGLADINGDGRMDFMEFSIACKLITNKLKGFELPAQLPTQMLQAPPSTLPVSGVMPGAGGVMPGAPRHVQPGMQGMGMPGMMPGQQPGMMPGQPRMPGMMPGMMGMPGQMPASMGGAMPGMVPNSMMGMGQMSMAGGMPGQMSMAGGMPGQMSMAGGVPANSMGGMPGQMYPGQPGMAPGMQQVPIPGVQPSVMPIVSNPAMPAAPAVAEIPWTIPQGNRVKSSQIFQANDRARTGFLAAVQARSLLLQTGLAQQTLAGVWNLSDIDKDGKLSCEEFILAMYLCEVAMKGEPLPAALPINLIPPSLRKYAPAAQAGSGTPGSVHSGVNEDMSSPASFEDRRKENWEAGQAELDKRRASLLEQQKKDEEDRKRKEKEEAEKREKQKQEVERRRQAELEKAAARAREVQEQQEEQKRRMEQQREQARVEMERQRLLEWERQRTAELEQHRQRETEKVITLRAKKETVNKELEDLKEKIKTLSDGITDTRTGVTDVKSFIDGMRTARDTKMAELNATKTRLKDQNVRLLQVTQEKSKLEAKNKINAAKMEEGRVVELTDFDLKKVEKQELLEKLREKLAITKAEEQQKKEKFEEDKKVLMEHRDKLRLMIETCKELHKGFDEKRLEVKAEKAKQIRELTDPNHAWGGSFDEPAFSPVAEVAPVVAAAVVPPVIPPAPSADSVNNATIGYVQYRALYDYEKRNDDELSFACGDIILVHPGQEHEPGWLGGELNSNVGWFPEAYAEKIGENGVDQTLHPIAEVPENGSDSSSLQDPTLVGGKAEGEAVPDSAPAVAKVAPAIPPAPVIPPAPSSQGEKFIVLYEYRSDEPGDLNLDAGELVVVTQKDGDWWTGQIGDRAGVFPYNYVEPAPVDGVEAAWGGDAVNGSGDPVNYGSGDPVNGAIHPAPVADPAVGWADPAIQSDPNAEAENETDKSGKKLEIATVIAPYEATSKEQLTLAKGQMILVRKKTDTGWWQGELQAGGKGKKRAVGWFPASYVQVKGGGGDDKKESPVASEPSAIAGAAQEKVVALFDYSGQYEDELSFVAGEEITIVAKDEEAWWRGEVNGRTGVFPSNYVEPVQK